MNVYRLVGGTVALSGLWGLGRRYMDEVKVDDSFSSHTNEQQKKHFISGMHEPYTPNKSQQALIEQHFSEFQHLIPSSSAEIRKETRLKSAVHIKKLAECPVYRNNMKNRFLARPGLPHNLHSHSPLASGNGGSLRSENSEVPPCQNSDSSSCFGIVEFSSAGTVVVGSPPALISTAFEKSITYINDGRKPIANGSAFHLEWDAVSEAPTTSQPVHFMSDQIKRLFCPEYLATTSQTGHFSWKSLDWISWIKNPSKWGIGIRIAVAFQRFTQSGPHPSVNEEVALRSTKNQRFYERLDDEMNNTLLMPGEGSVYIARNDAEKDSLWMQSTSEPVWANPLAASAQNIKGSVFNPDPKRAE